MREELRPPARVHDLRFDREHGSRVALALSPMQPSQRTGLIASLQVAGLAVTVLPERPGLVIMRTIAMLIKGALAAMLSGVANEQVIDVAMRHEVNEPCGRIAWRRRLGLRRVVAVLDSIADATRDRRCRIDEN